MSDRSVFVKARDGHGNLLPNATFKVYVDGEFQFEAGAGGDGVASIQNIPADAKLEIEASYEGEKDKTTIAAGEDEYEFAFDNVMAPPLAGSNGLDTRMFVVGCIMLVAALGMAFWAFDKGTLTADQRMIILWILPLASGFGAGAFAGGISVKARGIMPGLLVSATGGFGVWLLTYLLLPQPGVTPAGRAIEERDAARHYLALADQPGGQVLPNLQKSLAHYGNAARLFKDIPGQEVEYLASVGAQGLVSETMAYAGADQGRIYTLEDDAVVWSKSGSGDAVSLDTPDLQKGNIRCTDIRNFDAWDQARTHYLEAYAILFDKFAEPSANTPLPVVRNARSAAYFFICDCVRNGVDRLDEAGKALALVSEATKITNLNIKSRHEDALAKATFTEALGKGRCAEYASAEYGA